MARTPVAFLLFAILVYFGVRAWLSPVGNFALSDTSLVAMAFLLIGLGISLVTVHIIPVIMQMNDPAFSAFTDERVDKRAISGFFGHRIFFGTQMGTCAVVLGAQVLFTNRHIKIKWLWGIVALLAFVFTCLSFSRGPIAAMFAAATLVILIKVCISMFLRGVPNGLIIVALISSLLLCSLVGAVSVTHFYNQRGESADKGVVTDRSRAILLGLALRCEPENQAIGGGARFFSYEIQRTWSGAYVWWGAPYLAHNEYAQAYTDYGIIGLTLMILGILVVLVCGFLNLILMGKNSSDKGSRGSPLSLVIAISALLLVEFFHIGVNFVYHLQPTLFISALFIGLIIGFGKPSLSLLCRVLTCIRSGVTAIVAFWLLVSYIPLLALIPLEYRWAQNPEDSDLRIATLTELAGQSGYYTHWISLGEEHFARAYELEKSGSHEDIISHRQLALEAFQQANRDHPFFVTSWINIGRLHTAADRYANAEEALIKAHHMAPRREYRFPALGYAAHNYMLQGISAWNSADYEMAQTKFSNARYLFTEGKNRGFGNTFKDPAFWPWMKATNSYYFSSRAMNCVETARKVWAQRQSAKALALLETANRFFELSVRTGVKTNLTQQKEIEGWIKDSISFLKGARINPDTSIVEKQEVILNTHIQQLQQRFSLEDFQ